MSNLLRAQRMAAAVGLFVFITTAHVSFAQENSQPWIDEVLHPQYIAVFVADVDVASAWYTAALGVERIGGSRAENDSWQIENLANKRLFIELIRDDRAVDVDRARGFAKVGFFVADVHALANTVERLTGERPTVLEFKEHGINLIQLTDPDGNIIQISSWIDHDN